MTLITQAAQEKISAAITDVERFTHAELVTVLAKQADDYLYIPLLCSALIALLVPAILSVTPLWLEWVDMMWAQVVVFIIVASILHIPAILLKLVPVLVSKKTRCWHASNLAHRQFLQNNLHHTEGETGVLIFVSEAERYVEIIADRGINQHVKPEQWENIVKEFTQAIKNGETEKGFLRCIEQCGALLKEFCPAHDVKNELPNHLIIL